jgi:hypothetical protein
MRGSVATPNHPASQATNNPSIATATTAAAILPAPPDGSFVELPMFVATPLRMS